VQLLSAGLAPRPAHGLHGATELARRYVELEAHIQHRFQPKTTIRDLVTLSRVRC
jgi:hypothetical protein